jgi:enamine deaminase RidA (YjgF/YER057c/UK114 family)
MIMEARGVKLQRLGKIERISPWTQSVISIPQSFTATLFTQAVRIPAGHDLIVIGGQNGVDSSGRVVSDDFAGQARQALSNLQVTLGRRRPTLIMSCDGRS